jgi:hypothetical protein
MELNLIKTRVISFSRKTNRRIFDYNLCESLVTRTEFLKDLGVQIDSKLHFAYHVDYIFSQAIRLFELIRRVTFSFSSLQSLLMLYYTLVRPKLEYASVACNSITSTNATKLERIQWKFVSLRHRRFFSQWPYSYINVLNNLKFHTLSDLRCHLEALFYLMFWVVQNFVLSFWELSAFKCRIEISEILKCFMLTLAVATALPLDAFRRLMTSSAVVVHSIIGQFWLTICYQVSGYRGFAPVLLHSFSPNIAFVLFCLVFCVSYLWRCVLLVSFELHSIKLNCNCY